MRIPIYCAKQHSPNITTTNQGGFEHVRRVVNLINFRRQVIRFSRMIAIPVTQSQGQTHRAYMAGNPSYNAFG